MMNGIRYASNRIALGKSKNLIFTNLTKIYRNISENEFNENSYRRFHISSSCGINTGKQAHDKISKEIEISDKLIEKLKNTANDSKKINISEGPDLVDFILANSSKTRPSPKNIQQEKHPYLKGDYGSEQKVYFDVYGCQMNVNDTEIVWAILQENGYSQTKDIEDADIILIMTCAIREGAEQKIWGRLDSLISMKQKRKRLKNRLPVRIGLLGCMAERLKEEILVKKKTVDLVAGPDSYRDLPRLLAITDNHETAINVQLSFEETYADITPVRLNPNSLSAFVTIMRGCDNMCTYCIVPFVRGRERSRPVSSILDEVRKLSDQGIKEVTLLGQNVNSYRDLSESQITMSDNLTNMAKGFKTVYKTKKGGLRFSDLLDQVSLINPEMRIRFTSPHPKDFPDEVLQLIAERSNICKQIHLPAQSGNSVILERMRRGYTRESYLELVDHIRNSIPNIKLSSDFIAGFCGETKEQFEDTLTLMERVQYHNAYLFAYSLREKTTAHRRYRDDIPQAVKNDRLQRMVTLFRNCAQNLNRMQIGTQQLVLIEGESRKSSENLQGRTDGNTRVIISKAAIPSDMKTDIDNREINPGDYVVVQICGSNSNSLTGIPLYHSTLSEYSAPQDINDLSLRKAY